jgi:hypothetical protein
MEYLAAARTAESVSDKRIDQEKPVIVRQTIGRGTGKGQPG